MKTLLLIIIFTLRLSPAGAGATVTTVTGYRGGSVQIRCSYRAGSETYTKYLCRGSCSSIPWGPDEVARSDSDPKDKRFSQYDNTADKVFIVTITDLRPEDAGTYWCIVFGYYIKDYSRVNLWVKTDDPARRTLPTNFPLETHTALTAQYGSHQTKARRSSPGVAVTAVGFILLTAGVIVAVYWKMRSRGPRTETQTSTPTNGEKENNMIPLPPRTNTKPSEPIYQSLDPDSMQPDSEYQSLNPKTSQSDPDYQDVDPNSMQPDSEYQNLNPKTN